MEDSRPRVPPAAWLIGALLVMLALAMAGPAGRAEARTQLPQCADNIDNDGDRNVDYPFDSGCRTLTDAVEANPGARACADGNDNDGDGITDFPNEPGCESANDNSEGNPANVRNRPACADNADNDADGRIDFLAFAGFPFDPGCSWAGETSEADTACSDGIDNDGDGRVDFPADFGCGSTASAAAVNDNDETDPPQCNDGRDNDADGSLDELDPDCHGSTAGASEGIPTGPRPACSDGVDNDSDGKIDLADPGCGSSSDGDETNTTAYILPAGDLTNPGRTSSPSLASTRLLSPFPIVRLRGRTTRRGVRVTLLTVTAPLRSKVSVYCRGKGCPRRRVTVTAVKRLVRVRKFERRLRGGTELRIYVTRPGYIGKYTRFRFKSNHVPQRMDRCATSAGTRPRNCPTS